MHFHGAELSLRCGALRPTWARVCSCAGGGLGCLLRAVGNTAGAQFQPCVPWRQSPGKARRRRCPESEGTEPPPMLPQPEVAREGTTDR